MLLALLYDARAAVVVEWLQGYTHVHVAACVSGETHVTSKLDAAAGLLHACRSVNINYVARSQYHTTT